MKSPFANLFLDLQSQITDNVEEIKYVEQDLGQLGSEEPRNSLMFPAVLIDFINTSFDSLQGNNQMAIPTISVILVFDNYNNTNSLTPLEIKEQGLNYLEIEQQVVMALQGWQNDYCQPFTRIAAKSQNRNEIGLRVREITFTTEFEDMSCGDQSQLVSLSLNE